MATETNVSDKMLLEDFQLGGAVLATPFKKIAMALSGGGFRAASFSLGAMSYLNYVPYNGNSVGGTLLDNVEFVSSASGGTFTAMLYSMHVVKGIKFEQTYKELAAFMEGQVLLENILKNINDDFDWDDGKSRNFINAFAKVYDNELFKKRSVWGLLEKRGR